MARIELSEISTCLRTRSAWPQVYLDIRRGGKERDAIYLLDDKRGVKQVVDFKKGARKRRQSVLSHGGWRLLNLSDNGAVVAIIAKENESEKVVICPSLGGKQRQHHTVLQIIPSQKRIVHVARNDRNKGTVYIRISRS